MALQIKEVHWLEYDSPLSYVSIGKHLGARELPCRCAFGLLIDFTAACNDTLKLSGEVLDADNKSVLLQDFKILADRDGEDSVELKFEPVTLSKPGTYSFRLWRGDAMLSSPMAVSLSSSSRT